jgi:hypothetical protein
VLSAWACVVWVGCGHADTPAEAAVASILTKAIITLDPTVVPLDAAAPALATQLDRAVNGQRVLFVFDNVGVPHCVTALHEAVAALNCGCRPLIVTGDEDADGGGAAATRWVRVDTMSLHEANETVVGCANTLVEDADDGRRSSRAFGGRRSSCILSRRSSRLDSLHVGSVVGPGMDTTVLPVSQRTNARTTHTLTHQQKRHEHTASLWRLKHERERSATSTCAS